MSLMTEHEARASDRKSDGVCSFWLSAPFSPTPTSSHQFIAWRASIFLRCLMTRPTTGKFIPTRKIKQASCLMIFVEFNQLNSQLDLS